MGGTATAQRVDWRRLDRFLWVGSGPAGHVGTVEQGRRYLAVDTWGRVRGRCRTLAHAQQLLEALAPALAEAHAA